MGICWFRWSSSHYQINTDMFNHPRYPKCPSWKTASGCRGYLAELLSQSLLRDSQRSHTSDPTGCLNLVHIQTLHAFLCNQLNTNPPGYEASQRSAAPWPPVTAKDSYLVVRTDGPQLHDELEAQEVVCADGLELQEAAESHQLRPGEVVQRQLVLEQFGEFDDLLITGTFTRVPDLKARKMKV